MSLKSVLKKAYQKLSDLFDEAANLPGPEIQKEMESEGWKFQVEMPIMALPYGVMITPLVYIKTPEGKSAIGYDALPEDTKLYEDTVAEKRRQRNPAP